MGLLLDLNPDDGIDDGGNDEELEAELLQLMGGGGGGGRSQGRKSEGKSEELISFHHTVNTRLNTLLTSPEDNIFCNNKMTK